MNECLIPFADSALGLEVVGTRATWSALLHLAGWMLIIVGIVAASIVIAGTVVLFLDP